jgi:hypothetical protein
VVLADKTLSAESQKATDVLYRFYNKAASKLMPND